MVRRTSARSRALLLAIALVSAGAPSAAAPVDATAAQQQLPPALEAAIGDSREALRRILNGDPSGYAALFADRPDVTLGNPFGPFGKGKPAVLAALNNAASKYKDGSV